MTCADSFRNVTSDIPVYDGDDVLWDFVDSDGEGVVESPTISKRYLHGPATDQILAEDDYGTGDVLWYLTDNLGTVRDLAEAVTDGAGDVTDVVIDEHYSFDSFGNVLSGDTSKTRYLYTGRVFDSDTGLQYNRARWYDPATGNWLSEDPIGFGAGDTNLTRYVGYNVTNATDPTGLEGGYYVPPQHASDPRFRAGVNQSVINGAWFWTDVGTAFAPIVSDGRDWAEVLTGRDAITQQQLSPGEYKLTVAGAFFPVVGGKVFRKLGDAWSWLRRSDDLLEGFDEAADACRKAEGPRIDDTIANKQRIANKAQQARDTAPPKGLGSRTLSGPERAEFNQFADRARALGMVENPYRTGSWGEFGSGKFKERVRIDVGEAGKPGYSGKTHLNIPGDRTHFPPNAPLPGE